MNNIHTYVYIYNILVHTLKYTPMSFYNSFRMQLMGHINILMDENKCQIDPTNKMKFLIVAS
jgi:hypothetical protein